MLFKLPKIFGREPLERNGAQSIKVGALTLDVLFTCMEKIPKSDYIFFCFSGAVSPKRKDGTPFFEGAGIARRLGVPVVSFADTLVSRDPDCATSWHAGDKDTPALPEQIACIIDELCHKHQKKALLFGGSAGGFASMNTLSKLTYPASALVWNPQTNIAKYYIRSVRYYVQTALNPKISANSTEQELASALRSFNISHDLTATNFKSHRLVILQNIDLHDLDKHILPFMQGKNWVEMCPGVFKEKANNILLIVGDWGKGHCPPPRPLIADFLRRLAAQETSLHLAYQWQATPHTLKPGTPLHEEFYSRMENNNIAYTPAALSS